MTTRKGDFIQTYEGIDFYPLDPRPDEVKITDIAHALGMTCRFSGHVREFYSVAEHSVFTSRIVPRPHALRALLHDASEAYISDVARPVKKFMPEYKAHELKLQTVIYQTFGIEGPDPEALKIADAAMLATEASQLLRYPWHLHLPVPAKDFGHPLPCWSPQVAKQKFLDRFKELADG